MFQLVTSGCFCVGSEKDMLNPGILTEHDKKKEANFDQVLIPWKSCNF